MEKARETTLPQVLYGLGIANVGLSNAKVICKEFKNDLDAMLHADAEQLSEISGIGAVIAGTFTAYFAESGHM